MRILLDIMGADLPPRELVSGGIEAGHQSGFDIVFAGDSAAIRDVLASRGEKPGRQFDILPASQVVRMDDPPVRAVREKRDSSLALGLAALRDGHVDGFVSAGNTGAVVVASIFILGRALRIARPGILVSIPTLAGTDLLVIDVGANSDCSPEHLVDFGLMGATYAREALRIDRPTLGLLNIGTEPGKGSKLTRRASDLLDAAPLPFVGSVEAHHLLGDRPVDVVVCEGFVGNVFLKAIEGGVSAATNLLRRSIRRRIVSKLGALLLQGAFAELRDTLSYRHRGGAPLLGVNGVVVIAHGRSDSQAIASAIEVAHRQIEADLVSHFSRGVDGWSPDAG